MKRLMLVIVVQRLFCFSLAAQAPTADSLYTLLHKTVAASKRYTIQNELVDFYIEKNRDSALYFANNCIALAEENNMLLDRATSLSDKGHALMHLERLIEAYTCFKQALEIAGDSKNNQLSWNPEASANTDKYRLKILSGIYHDFGNMLGEAGIAEESLQHYREAQKIANEIGDSTALAFVLLDLGNVYINLSKADSALAMEQTVVRILSKQGIVRPLGYANMLIAKVYQSSNNDSLALVHYHKALAISLDQQNYTNLRGTYRNLARFYTTHKPNADSAIYYARKTLAIAIQTGTSNYADVYSDLVKAFQLNGNRDSILKYQSLSLTAKDLAYNQRIATINELQHLAIQEQEKLSLAQEKETEIRNRFRIYFSLFLLLAACIILMILYRANRKKQKANGALQKAFADLKATQAQLIQSEKMASLGELTAGIAHEIQNPLNFVNNFSEINNELIDELRVDKAKLTSDDYNELLASIYQNNEKILHHGKRADAIVKGMLQHSRTSSGQKEPIDLNALCDEYLRLSYHGLRAKDKSFNADFKTSFDQSIGKINIVPQDIGRVLLNLITNAFHAVKEKQDSGMAGYQPTVIVSTKKLGDKIEITVADNGGGIPQNILDKIFQPFFTTKPTGQGTGLGLSLAYDIVKAHGGELKVETKEGEGTAFRIQLPKI